MQISRLLRCFSSLSLLLVVFCVSVKNVDAQTATITRTPAPTRTPIVTFTPESTLPPGGSRFDCPAEQYYYDEVDIQYITQCGRCLMIRTPTPDGVGNDIPNAPIGNETLPVPTFEGTPNLTPSATIPVTYYPTITPTWYQAATLIPSATLPPTPTDLPGGVTLTPTNTPFPPDFVVYTDHIDFSDADTSDYHNWQLTDSTETGAYGYIVTAPYILGNPTGFHPSQIFLAAGLDWLLDNQIYVYDIEFNYHSAVRSCVGGTCGNDVNFGYYLGDDFRTGTYVNHEVSYGYPGFHAAFDENTDHLITLDINQWISGFEFGVIQYPGAGTQGFDYISDLYIHYGYYLTEPATPTITPTSTSTLTPAPTLTPNPNEVDCRNPFQHNELPPLIETDVTGGIVQQECYIIIPEGMEIDLTGFRSDLYWSVDGLQVCISFIALPSLSIMGVNIPIAGFAIAVMVGFIFRRFATF